MLRQTQLATKTSVAVQAAFLKVGWGFLAAFRCLRGGLVWLGRALVGGLVCR